MKGVPSFNDEWFKEATKDEVVEIYKGKPEYTQALDHWKKLNPPKRKTPVSEEK